MYSNHIFNKEVEPIATIGPWTHQCSGSGFISASNQKQQHVFMFQWDRPANLFLKGKKSDIWAERSSYLLSTCLLLLQPGFSEAGGNRPASSCIPSKPVCSPPAWWWVCLRWRTTDSSRVPVGRRLETRRHEAAPKIRDSLRGLILISV